MSLLWGLSGHMCPVPSFRSSGSKLPSSLQEMSELFVCWLVGLFVLDFDCFILFLS